MKEKQNSRIERKGARASPLPNCAPARHVVDGGSRRLELAWPITLYAIVGEG